MPHRRMIVSVSGVVTIARIFLIRTSRMPVAAAFAAAVECPPLPATGALYCSDKNDGSRQRVARDDRHDALP